MDLNSGITAICTFLGTGLAAWLTYLATAGRTRKDFIEKLLDECQELRESLSKKDGLVLELQQEVKKLQNEVHALRDELIRYESTKAPTDSTQILEVFFQSFPTPVWVHEVGANKWYVNDIYTKIFSIKRKDFWTPINVFQYYPAELAAQFVSNDMDVVESGVGQYFTEKFPQRIMEVEDQTNMAIDWDVVKIPVRAGGRSYVIGCCTNEKHNVTIVDFFKQVDDMGS
tara:strand:+ start:1037 stop:1720 length:684 start_codon:yes stop_codon:yes gene_type:complete